MKTVKIVFYQSGEINGTFSPKCFLENFTGDLDEKCERLVSHDMWMPITVDMYRVSTGLIPDWMDEKDYLDNYISLQFAVAQGMPEGFSRIEFMNFKSLGERYQYFIGWLFKKHSKSKNAFMVSIFNQVCDWLVNENNKFPQPLSQKQFEAASRYCPLYNARKIATATYYQS